MTCSVYVLCSFRVGTVWGGKMDANYDIVFTPAARSFAKAKLSVAGIEEKCRIELSSLLDEGYDLADLQFHRFGKDHEWVCFPELGGEHLTIVIDVVVYEYKVDSAVVGPLKGKAIMVPHMSSDDNEEDADNGKRVGR